MKYVLTLDECDEHVADKVGGKANGLSMLIRTGLPVPAGFAVSTDAYRACVDEAGLGPIIANLSETAQSPTECQAASEAIRALFVDSILTREIAREIADAYLVLGGGIDVPVAIRSSATAEDTADASFAGQQDTYLFIRGVDEVQQYVVKCWASLFSAQAIGYRARFGVPADGLAMAVVVQRMVEAEAAGVLMTLDPTNGDMETIYIESALGLGEGVVRGDVACDRYWVDKTSHVPVRASIANKEGAHRFDSELGMVRIVPVPPALSKTSSLRDEEVMKLAEIALLVENTFGYPVDMEWAVESQGTDRRSIFLLQARPETVWSSRLNGEAIDRELISSSKIGTLDAWDNLHTYSAPHLHWATSNFGEAMPGVSTPLSWSIWGPAAEMSLRGGAFAIGAMSRKENRMPENPDDRIARIYFGQPAAMVEFLATLGDRLPGTSGRNVVRDLLGNVPADMTFKPTWRRYPIIAWRLPWTLFTAPGRTRKLARQMNALWSEHARQVPTMDIDSASAVMRASLSRFEYSMTLQAAVLFGIVTPLYNAIDALVRRTGIGDTASLSGFGGAEMEVVGDIWRTSRGEISIHDVVTRHGFHGPAEGELSSKVWREDASPLKALLADYAARSPEDDPRLHATKRRLAAVEIERKLIRAFPFWRRPFIAILLKLAAKNIPLRGISKRSFLQMFDIARACARRLGEILVAEGRLEAVDDVFYLTAQELTLDFPPDAKQLVAKRKNRRGAYEKVRVPSEWQGMPAPLYEHENIAHDATTLHGVGVSSGIVEGRARILLQPDFGEVKAGEILVSATTDPSWCSVMFISSGLVVDIGGALSHAAIVARELGIPCVVNTQGGSRLLRTGDLLRVNGTTGKVDILERAA